MAININYGAPQFVPALMAMLAGRRQSYGPGGGTASSPIGDVGRIASAGFDDAMSGAMRSNAISQQIAQKKQYDSEMQAADLAQRQRMSDEKARQARLDALTFETYTPEGMTAFNNASRDISDATYRFQKGELTQDQADAIIQQSIRAQASIPTVRMARPQPQQRENRPEFSVSDLSRIYKEAQDQAAQELEQKYPEGRQPTQEHVNHIASQLMNRYRRDQGRDERPIEPITPEAMEGIISAAEVSANAAQYPRIGGASPESDATIVRNSPMTRQRAEQLAKEIISLESGELSMSLAPEEQRRRLSIALDEYEALTGERP